MTTYTNSTFGGQADVLGAATTPQQPVQLSAAGPAGQLSVPAPTPCARGPAAAVLLSLLPIALLLLVTLVRRISLPSSTSLPAAAALLAVIRLCYLSSPPLFVLGSVTRGVLESATPLSVIYGAILLFEVMQHTRCLPWMMHEVKSLSAGEPLAEVFLIGWAFSFMISGVGGFNTPIALSAPMLASLGHDPVRSLLVVVLLNTLASHLGSVGMAVWFGFKSLGLGHANILLIGLKSAILVGAISFIIPPIAASFLVPWCEVARCGVFVVLSITSAVVPTAVVAAYSAEFPVLIGGVAGILCTTLLAYYRIGLGPDTHDWQQQQRQSHVPDTVVSLRLQPSSTLAPATAAAAEASAALKRIRQIMLLLLSKFMNCYKSPCTLGSLTSVTTSKTQDNNVTLLSPVPPAIRVQGSDADIELCNLPGHHDESASHHLQAGTPGDRQSKVSNSSAASTHPGVTQPPISNPATGLPPHQLHNNSTEDLQSFGNLATVSCPAVYRAGVTHPWDDDDDVIGDADSEGVSNPVGGLGCHGLWEDNHSAMLTVLPALLVAATIHHAALSGVSRVPWFAGLGHSIMHAAAAAGPNWQQQQQQQGWQQQCESEVRGSSRSNDAGEIQPAAAAAAAAARPLRSDEDLECGGLITLDTEAPDLQPHSAAAAAAAAMDLGYHGLLEYQQQQQQRQQHQQWWQTLLKHHSRQKSTRKGLRRGLKGQSGWTVMFWRTLPIWLTVLLLLLTRTPQIRLQAALQSTEPSVTLQLGTFATFSLSASLVMQLQQIFSLAGVDWKYEVMYVPCLVPFVVAGAVTLVVFRRDMRDQQLGWWVPFKHAAHKMKGTFSAIIGAMVLSELLSAGGIGSPAFIVGYYLSSWLGQGYLAIAGFLGALGGFVSGSVMAGNMTFGAIQKVAAERIGVSVTSMLAVQTAGSCAGKMMCISNILSAKVMMDLHNMREGKIIRRTAPLAVLFVILAQALGLIFTLGGIWPDQPLGGMA